MLKRERRPKAPPLTMRTLYRTSPASLGVGSAGVERRLGNPLRRRRLGEQRDQGAELWRRRRPPPPHAAFGNAVVLVTGLLLRSASLERMPCRCE